jgi:CheY-like chemotaxis protein
MMDCQMPIMDGFAASRRIRSREHASGGNRVPIIALTANVMQGDRERCLAAGMDDYLAKPIKREQLEEVLARWIRPTQSAETKAPPSEAPPPALQLVVSNDRPAASDAKSAAAPAVVLDAETIAGIRALGRSASNDFLARVVARYVEDTPQLMERMRAAMQSADAAALRLAAHTLKSSSATVGAKAAAALCKELETLGRNGSFEGAPELMSQLETELTGVYAALQAEATRQAVG